MTAGIGGTNVIASPWAISALEGASFPSSLLLLLCPLFSSLHSFHSFVLCLCLIFNLLCMCSFNQSAVLAVPTHCVVCTFHFAARLCPPQGSWIFGHSFFYWPLGLGPSIFSAGCVSACRLLHRGAAALTPFLSLLGARFSRSQRRAGLCWDYRHGDERSEHWSKRSRKVHSKITCGLLRCRRMAPIWCAFYVAIFPSTCCMLCFFLSTIHLFSLL